MRNIRIVIEYDGSSYSGWQSQDNSVGIQEIIEEAIPEAVPEIEIIEEPIPEAVPEIDEIEIIEDEIPLALPKLPKTGDIPSAIYYALGTIFLGLGIGTRKKK